MYRIGQQQPVSRQPGESRWAWWVLPMVGAVAGDYLMAGRLRPWLVLPHNRWRTERKGRIGAAAGGIAGIVAALVVTRGDLKSIPPEML